jgi:glycosyltransferase involved in cell wall biosynthesis
MRICLNLLAALAGGQLTRAHAFMERFPRLVSDAELVVLKERSVLTQWRSSPDFQVKELDLGGLGGLRAVRRSAWEHFRLQGFMRAAGADIFLTFSHFLPKNFPRSVPSVVGIANLAPFSTLARNAEHSLMRAKLALLERSILSAASRATRVIALSETCKQVLVDRAIDAEKIVVIPNGIDPSFAQPADGGEVLRENGIARPYLLYVGHFFRYKNQITLLKAFAKLPSSLRAAYQLVLVGGTFERGYFDELVRMRDAQGLRESVVLIPGEVGARLRRLYQDSTLFVFPSLVENCPNSLLEAMAAGAPVLASDIEPMPEFCAAAGRYFDALDADALAGAISAVLCDPAELQAMRLRSKAQAQMFSWDAFVRGVVQTCHDALRAHTNTAVPLAHEAAGHHGASHG